MRKMSKAQRRKQKRREQLEGNSYISTYTSDPLLLVALLTLYF